jgi:hypothetical protein
MLRCTFSDACNTITATQSITVQPAPPPAFDAVTDLTITCAEGDIITPSDLDYTNSETGECEISGTVTGVITGSLDECGGTLTQTWTFSDA